MSAVFNWPKKGLFIFNIYSYVYKPPKRLTKMALFLLPLKCPPLPPLPNCQRVKKYGISVTSRFVTGFLEYRTIIS